MFLQKIIIIPHREISYLSFTALIDSTIKINAPTNPDIKYSFDKLSWTQWDYNEIALTAGQTIYMKGYNKYGFSKSYNNYNQFVMTGQIECNGNIMSLLYEEKIRYKNDIPNAFCFYKLFYACSALTTAPELPAKIMTISCYSEMFYKCSGLTSTPNLNATILNDSCYKGMFMLCTNLLSTCNLPAKIVNRNSYEDMFRGCTKLKYTTTEIGGNTVQSYGCRNMYYGCTQLLNTPKLPSTTVMDYCYSGMFKSCQKITEIPELPATTLGLYSYDAMFFECYALNGKVILPAKKLTTYCYYRMFYRCTKINDIIIHATDISASNCLTEWLYGVSSTGTFTKDANTTFTNGPSGIPAGWTVKDIA